MKITLTIEVEVDDTFFFNTEEDRAWFTDLILIENDLSLFSNEVGDTIGVITKVADVEYVG